MINHSRWEYENQDYLKEHYEKRMWGKDTHLHVRRFHCKGCGRVFYSSLGHHDDVFDNSPNAAVLMKRGMLWAAEGKQYAIDNGLTPEKYENNAKMY